MIQRRQAPSGLTRRAMTLIELMVSLALGVILIGIMVQVWTTSQQIMSRTTDQIAVYQNLRNILDIIERDIANVVKTTDMEFFDDKSGNGHYDLATGSNAEELPELFAARNGTPPAGVLHPFANQNMFGDQGSGGLNLPSAPDGNGKNLNSVPYFYAPVLYRPASYPAVPVFDDPTVTSHRQDEFYFRTFANVDQQSQPVLVHYRLFVPQNSPQRPTLVRRLIWIDQRSSTDTVRERIDELAEGITDLEFAMFYKESRIHDKGIFLDAKEARNVNSDGDANIPGLDQQYNATAVSLVYAGDAIIERTAENGVWLRPDDPKIQFGSVRPGDRFLLTEATDDDSIPGTANLGDLFGERFVTVESIIALQPSTSGLGSNQSKVFVKFVEPIDFFPLNPGLGTETTTSVTEFGEADKTRTIFQSFQVKFRVGFLPGAFRVRFRYRDFRARRLVPFERVVRVLNS